MPLIAVFCNVATEQQQKQKLADALIELLSDETKSSRSHIHVHIQDGEFFSFGGDSVTPAAYVSIKAAANSINAEARKALVSDMGPLLAEVFPHLLPNRVFTLFEDIPVEKLAVGTNIATFGRLSQDGRGRISQDGRQQQLSNLRKSADGQLM